MSSFSLERAVRESWNEVVLTDSSGARMLFSDLVRGVCRFHILFEEAGVSAGDRIALCGGDSLRHAAARFAVHAYEAEAVEIPNDLSAVQIEESLRRFDPVLFLIDGEVWERLSDSYSLRDLPDAVSSEDGSALRARRTVVRAAKRLDALYAEQYPRGICAGDVSAAAAADLLAMLRTGKQITG